MNILCGYMIILSNYQTTSSGIDMSKYCNTLFSISDHCSFIIPDSSGISELNAKLLDLDKTTKQKLKEYIKKLLETEELIWPDVFTTLQSAKEFKRRFLSNRNDVYIIAIGLPEDFFEDFIENQCPEESHHPYIYKMLKRNIKLDLSNGEMLGYDICGYNGKTAAPTFYSYLCNNLHTKFIDLGIRINKYMLISNFEDAKKVIDLIDKKIVHADSDYLWYPWIVINVA
jgi:hypothetical protein